MKIKNYAPVIVTVYDRPEFFLRCVNSLAKNFGAERTSLYISSDGPIGNGDEERVAEVRNIISNITGFKEVVPYIVKENTGGSIINYVRNDLKKKYDSFILSEDDNEFSPYFLRFLNEGLTSYKDDPDVLAVCGYLHPIDHHIQNDYIFQRRRNAWGYATWTRKENDFRKSSIVELAAHFLSSFEKYTFFAKKFPHVASKLPKMKAGTMRAGDLQAGMYCLKHNKLAVYPRKSLVRNLGFDGSGKHCKKNEDLARQEINMQEISCSGKLPVEPNELIEDLVAKYHGRPKYKASFPVYVKQKVLSFYYSLRGSN